MMSTVDILRMLRYLREDDEARGKVVKPHKPMSKEEFDAVCNVLKGHVERTS